SVPVTVTNPSVPVTLTNPSVPVSVTNTPTVNIAPGASLAIKDGSTPFSSGNLSCETFNTDHCFMLVSVPAGQRLVVEDFNAALGLPSGTPAPLFVVDTTLGGKVTEFLIPPTQTIAANAQRQDSLVAQSVKLYHDGGQDLVITCTGANAVSTFVSCVARLSG